MLQPTPPMGAPAGAMGAPKPAPHSQVEGQLQQLQHQLDQLTSLTASLVERLVAITRDDVMPQKESAEQEQLTPLAHRLRALREHVEAECYVISTLIDNIEL